MKERVTLKVYIFKEIKEMDNYDKLVERISNAAKLEKDDIERKVEAKRAKLSGLVSREGAAQIVAAELGINLDQERLKINELVQGMKRANVIGKIIELYPVREFNKNGKEGKVASFLMADEESNIRGVLWDTNHIAKIESGEIKEGTVIEISNGGVRNGELHLSSFSDFKKSKEIIDNVVIERVFSEKGLDSVSPGQSAKIRAFIVQVFEPRYFELCPKCRKKVVNGKCGNCGEVKGEKRALINLVLDDGRGNIRAVIFGGEIEKLGLSSEEIFSLERFATKKSDLLGEEKIFSGNIRSNQLYNTTEFNIESISDISASELVKELEAKV